MPSDTFTGFGNWDEDILDGDHDFCLSHPQEDHVMGLELADMCSPVGSSTWKLCVLAWDEPPRQMCSPSCNVELRTRQRAQGARNPVCLKQGTDLTTRWLRGLRWLYSCWFYFPPSLTPLSTRTASKRPSVLLKQGVEFGLSALTAPCDCVCLYLGFFAKYVWAGFAFCLLSKP